MLLLGTRNDRIKNIIRAFGFKGVRWSPIPTLATGILMDIHGDKKATHARAKERL